MIGPGRARLPIVGASDEEAIKLGRLMCGVPLNQEARIARIDSTKHLQDMQVSEALLREAIRPLERMV